MRKTRWAARPLPWRKKHYCCAPECEAKIVLSRLRQDTILFSNKTMKHVSFSLPLILLLSIGCLAQELFEPRIDAYIKSEMQTQQIPGLSLAVIKDGRIVLAKGYGLANVEHQVPGANQSWKAGPRSSSHPQSRAWARG